jgi:hypothetical protein
MSQTKAQLVSGLNLNPSAPATALQIDASGNINIDSNTLYVDAANNRVGLGTSSPSSLLHLSVATAASDGTKGVRISNPAGTTAIFECGSSNDSYIGTTSGSDFSIRTNNTPRIYVTNGGNVGIGSISPDANSQLHVVGSSYQPLYINTTGTGGGGAAFLRSGTQALYVGTAGGSWLTGSSTADGLIRSEANLIFSIGNSEKTRLDSSGRLLVGTSTARDKFNNASGETPNVQIEGTGTTASGLYMLSMTANNTSSSAAAGPAMFFGRSEGATTGSYTVVSADKNLGRISFQGADGTEFVEAAKIDCFVDGTPGANDMPGRLVFSTTADGASSPTERMRIFNSGNTRFVSAGDGIRIGVTAGAGTATALLWGSYSATAGNPTTGTDSIFIWSNGNIQNTNNSYTAISDIKLKENIADANSQWADVKALRVRNYNLKEGQTHRQIGLIAQEVEPISPGLVYETPDRDAEGNDLGTVTKSVNYSVLYMKAVKALQEAMERIEALEAKVAALEGA